MEVEIPWVRDSEIAEGLADPDRIALRKADHREGLRKLDTAVRNAVGHGATWAEILEVVERAAAEEASTSRIAANIRAFVHDGDLSF